MGSDAPAVQDGFIAIDDAHRVRGMAAAFGCGASTRGATGRAPSPRREKKQGTVAAKNLVASLSGQSLTQLEEKSAVLDGLLWLGSRHLAHRGGTLLEGWAAKTIFAGYHASVLPGAISKARLAGRWLTESKPLLSTDPKK
jgi:NADH dehydrogenase FAD-containing subunit